MNRARAPRDDAGRGRRAARCRRLAAAAARRAPRRPYLEPRPPRLRVGRGLEVGPDSIRARFIYPCRTLAIARASGCYGRDMRTRASHVACPRAPPPRARARRPDRAVHALDAHAPACANAGDTARGRQFRPRSFANGAILNLTNEEEWAAAVLGTEHENVKEKDKPELRDGRDDLGAPAGAGARSAKARAVYSACVAEAAFRRAGAGARRRHRGLLSSAARGRAAAAL